MEKNMNATDKKINESFTNLEKTLKRGYLVFNSSGPVEGSASETSYDDIKFYQFDDTLIVRNEGVEIEEKSDAYFKPQFPAIHFYLFKDGELITSPMRIKKIVKDISGVDMPKLELKGGLKVKDGSFNEHTKHYVVVTKRQLEKECARSLDFEPMTRNLFTEETYYDGFQPGESEYAKIINEIVKQNKNLIVDGSN